MSEKRQQTADSQYSSITTEKLKNFIFAGDIITPNDFFNDIFGKLETLKKDIEANRNNEKNLFYNDNNNIPKNEEDCRDIIFMRLKDRYGYDLSLTREGHEGDNCIDINIKYKAKPTFEVQVECKRDDNTKINTGISEQLIPKYLESKVEYGIYLIFYFGYKKNLPLLLNKINNDIPEDYKERIKVLYIDLTKRQTKAH